MRQIETSVDETGNLSGKSTLKICSQTHVDTPGGGWGGDGRGRRRSHSAASASVYERVGGGRGGEVVI